MADRGTSQPQLTYGADGQVRLPGCMLYVVLNTDDLVRAHPPPGCAQVRPSAPHPRGWSMGLSLRLHHLHLFVKQINIVKSRRVLGPSKTRHPGPECFTSTTTTCSGRMVPEWTSIDGLWSHRSHPSEAPSRHPSTSVAPDTARESQCSLLIGNSTDNRTTSARRRGRRLGSPVNAHILLLRGGRSDG